MQRTILFIDEIHRFNKAQQDFLLPYVENGIIILIGATTENPYFEINGALLSRSQIFELRPLEKEALKEIIDHAMKSISGYCDVKISITDEAADFFINVADGDARQILNAIDLAIRTTEEQNNEITVTLPIAEECIQRKVKQYDKDGDNHYDCISAFIESMRHSEVDAALYYLARMLDRGEDPKYIARRILIFAAEDVGLADTDALHVATDTFLSVERIGMPECVYALAMATIKNSMSPKSNTVGKSYFAALQDAKNLSNIDIPMTLRDESYKSAWKLGRGGVSDVYASPEHYDGFACMPEALKDRHYFTPGNFGREPEMKPYFDWINSYKAALNNATYERQRETEDRELDEIQIRLTEIEAMLENSDGITETEEKELINEKEQLEERIGEIMRGEDKQ